MIKHQRQNNQTNSAHNPLHVPKSKKKIRERERELERRGPWQREAETSPSAYEGQPSSALPPALLRHLCLWLESDSSQTLSTKLSSRPIVRDRDKERELCIHIG